VNFIRTDLSSAVIEFVTDIADWLVSASSVLPTKYGRSEEMMCSVAPSAFEYLFSASAKVSL
jgi:hypothetical protein